MCISDWHAKGATVDRPADECTADEIAEEVWAQLQDSSDEITRAHRFARYHLDDEIIAADPASPDPARRKATNNAKLLVNQVNRWRLRPDAQTQIPNLFLAADYVRTHTDLATMEGANEAARRAVNAILDASGSDADRCRLWPLHEPLALEVGQKAPDFTLGAPGGKQIKLADLTAKGPVVLYTFIGAFNGP